MRGAVYDRPRAELPCLAVILNANDEVMLAKSVPSVEAGELFLAKLFEEFKAARAFEKLK